jgi:hypothetical protein
MVKSAAFAYPNGALPPEMSDLHARRQTIHSQIVEMAYRGYVLATEAELCYPTKPLPRSESANLPPLSFSPAIFQCGQLLLAEASGSSTAPPATRLVRIYDPPTFAQLILQEHDYFSSRIIITVIKESVNATVLEWPATTHVLCAPSERTRAHITWWTPRMMYSLQAWSAYLHPTDVARRLTACANEIASQKERQPVATVVQPDVARELWIERHFGVCDHPSRLART